MASFMARVLHIKPGDQYTMQIIGFKSQCIILQARKKIMFGYILIPDLSTERDGYCYAAKGTIAYTMKEAKEIHTLKTHQKIRVEFLETPTISGQKPEKILCVCRYIGK